MVRIEKVKQTRIEVPATPLLAECAQIMNITYDHDDDHNDDEETLKFKLLNLWTPVILSQKRKIPDGLIIIMLLVDFNGSMIIIISSVRKFN